MEHPHRPQRGSLHSDIDWLRRFCAGSGAVGVFLLAFPLWAAIADGRPDLAALEGAFMVFLGVGTLLSLVSESLLRAGAAAGILGTLLLPCAIAWQAGGFEASGARSLWSVAAPIAAIVVWNGRRAAVLLAAFAFLQGALMVLGSPHPPLSEGIRLAMERYDVVGTLLYACAALAAYRIHADWQARVLRERELEHRAVEMKSEILNVTSHEIRTPLNAIIGLLDLMSTEPMSPRQEEHLRTVQFASENLLLLVNDVLDYSKLDADAMRLESTPFDAGLVLRSTLLAQERQARVGEVELSGDWDQESPRWVMGDPVRLAQILSNLVSNAVKFSRGGRVEVRGSWAGGCLFLSVRDNGIGIPPDRIETIFEPFVQAESSTTRRFGGTGLGLAIVRRIVVAAGGAIQVRSTPGEGSLFEVRIPWNQTAPATRPESREPLLRWRILLVEDNALNTLVAERLLRNLGQDVAAVPGGEEAIAWLEENECDLVLMDIQMPGLDGIATTRIIRKRWGPDLPILALSAESMRHVQERAMQAGMDGLLSKPINSARLRACLAQRQAMSGSESAC